MGADQNENTESTKVEILSAMKQSGQIVSSAFTTVNSAVLRLMSGSSSGAFALDDLSCVVRGALKGIREAGGDIGLGSKGIIQGVIRAAHSVDVQSMETLEYTANCIVKTACDLLGDIVSASRGSVEGAIASAKETGSDFEGAALAAGAGAVRAAQTISAEAEAEVQMVVRRTLAGAMKRQKEIFVIEKK